MTYISKIKFQFDAEWTNTSHYGGYTDEMVPEEHIVVTAPAQDLTTPQLFKLFSNFLRAMGHDEVSIMKGGCSVAFSEYNSTAVMRKVAEEYDVILQEDYDVKVEEAVKKEREIDEEWFRIRNLTEKYDELVAENLDLKAKLSRFENPDAPDYTSEEIDAMCYEADKK